MGETNGNHWSIFSMRFTAAPPSSRVPRLTGVCKNEIIATNRPRHPWIPAYAGMTEWAR